MDYAVSYQRNTFNPNLNVPECNGVLGPPTIEVIETKRRKENETKEKTAGPR
jgi:hypothetical protein